MQKHHKYHGQKIYTYVSKSEIIRLKAISKTYGFNSVYQLQKYLVDCFLRSVDPINDTNEEPVPQAISEIFINPEEYISVNQSNVGSNVNKTQLLIPFGGPLNKEMHNKSMNAEISDEIQNMFDEHSNWETEPTITNSNYSGMKVKQTPDQRKYKTPDDLK